MSLRFPQSGSYDEFVSFQPLKYRTNSRGGAGAPTGQPVVIYMPSNIAVTSNGSGFAQRDFSGPAGRALKEFAGAAADGARDSKFSVEDALNRMQGSADSLTSVGADAIAQGLLEAGGSLAGMNANNILQLGTNPAVYNPNVELMYQGPKVRTFSFNIPMAPTSSADAKAAGEIIKYFKARSAAAKSGSNFLEIPDVWQVTYGFKGAEHPVLNQFKPAACTNITISCNQNVDVHSSYLDGFPINATMALQFLEIDVVLRGDQLESKAAFGY